MKVAIVHDWLVTYAGAERVLEQMLKLVAETDTALMVVTHSQNVAARMDRQLLLIEGKLQ